MDEAAQPPAASHDDEPLASVLEDAIAQIEDQVDQLRQQQERLLEQLQQQRCLLPQHDTPSQPAPPLPESERAALETPVRLARESEVRMRTAALSASRPVPPHFIAILTP